MSEKEKEYTTVEISPETLYALRMTKIDLNMKSYSDTIIKACKILKTVQGLTKDPGNLEPKEKKP
jgi:hypothetical protein